MVSACLSYRLTLFLCNRIISLLIVLLATTIFTLKSSLLIINVYHFHSLAGIDDKLILMTYFIEYTEIILIDPDYPAEIYMT